MSGQKVGGIPAASASISVREAHLLELLASEPSLPFVEVLADNFLAMRGRHYQLIRQVAERYPVVLHCVGMSVGSTHAPAAGYVQRIAALARDLSACAVSDHLSVSAMADEFVHDLLPIQYREACIPRLVKHIRQVQEHLPVPLLLENISRYLAYRSDEISEGQLFGELHRQTGVGLLFDVNNLYVTAHNLQCDVRQMLNEYPIGAVQQYHLAGYQERPPLLVDTHGCPVSPPVWELYALALARFGAKPTIIEWDNDLPPLAELLSTVARAQRLMMPLAGVA
ncbi:DUF692 domain-containing protein [Corallincola spongiicola]|uniref:DUF692 domain-containing protein n=1 Tax=Corallincola spongiicola TaxID=2520508 RepID=A0ABY1WNG4_9GAMM|nr:DUF692 domain-containing protein [Corallincola spongiicola]TAA45097.1 DUF692 domain-containing protein [Corallincola spongiicola]